MTDLVDDPRIAAAMDRAAGRVVAAILAADPAWPRPADPLAMFVDVDLRNAAWHDRLAMFAHIVGRHRAAEESARACLAGAVAEVLP